MTQGQKEDQSNCERQGTRMSIVRQTSVCDRKLHHEVLTIGLLK